MFVRGMIGLFGTTFLASMAVTSAQAQTADLKTALEQRIASGMQDIPTMVKEDEPHGIARVAFTVGNDGRTHDVRISAPSGDRRVDREAVRLVSSFHDLPRGQDPSTVNYAVLQYSTSSEGQEPDHVKRRLDSAVQTAYAQIRSDRQVALASAQPAPAAAGSAIALTAATVASVH